MTFRFPAPRWPTANLMTFRRVSVNPEEPIAEGDDLYTFRLNPHQLRVSRPKLENWKLTKGGFERQYWRNDLVRFVYTGLSGVFRPDEVAIINERGLIATDVRIDPILRSPGEYDIRETFAWRKFEQFEQFYNDHGEDFIRMNYWGQPRAWTGSLNGFEYDVDAKNPRLIRYSFTFTGNPRDDLATVQSSNSQLEGGGG